MIPPTSSANPFRFVNFTPASREELRDLTDVWLAEVCAAAWVTKEAQKLAGVIAEYVMALKVTAIYARDFESKYFITSEEVNRGLKMLKLFGALEDFTIDRGRLTVAARVTLSQRVRLAELQARHRELAAETVDQTATACVEELRAAASELHVVAGAIASVDVEATAEPMPLAANG